MNTQQQSKLQIINTGDAQYKPSVVMLVYGEGGVGKTTFTSTAPNPLLADCENGAKYFGLRGINMPVAQIQNWSQMKDFLDIAKSGEYETVIIDPIGELMDKLKKFMIATGDSKLAQKDGSPTMAGWGWLKKVMRDYIKALRDCGKHVIIVAHVEEKDDEGRMVKRPMVETKLSAELVNIVDIVAYMTVIGGEGEEKRILRVDPSNDKFTAKDRTGQLGKIIEPDFTKIINACQGTKSYSWSKPLKNMSREEQEEGFKIATKEDIEEEKKFIEKSVKNTGKDVAKTKAQTVNDKLNKAKNK